MIYPEKKPSVRDVCDHYDELDSFYRAIWGEHLHHGLWLSTDESVGKATRRLVDRVAQQARLAAGDVVCDVGAGYGATACYLTCKYKARVVALTISRAQYDYAQARDSRHNGPIYLLGSWLDNNFASETFDGVVAIESLAHMEDKQQFFSEAFRTLRPGGRLVVCAWLASANPKPGETRFLLKPICREGRLPGLGTAGEYRQMIKRAGFTLEDYQNLSTAVRKTWTVVIKRSLMGLFRDFRYLRFLLDASNRNRSFARTVFRIWLAYRTGALQYGLFVARKPHGSQTQQIASEGEARLQRRMNLKQGVDQCAISDG